LSRKCESLDVSQPYEPPPPVTGIALAFTSDSDCTELNDYMAVNNNLNDVKEVVVAWLKVLLRHLYGENEEYHEKTLN
jgi:hypothetical protein